MHMQHSPTILLFSENPSKTDYIQITHLQPDGSEVPLYNVFFGKSKKSHVRITAAPNALFPQAWGQQSMTTIGEVKFHTLSSKIDVSIFNQRPLQMARTDPVSSSHHFRYGTSDSLLGGGALWKEDSLISDSLKLKTYSMKGTKSYAARYWKKMKCCNRKDRAGFEIAAPVPDRMTLDAIVVTGIAMVKYRIDSDKAWGKASDDIVDEVILGVLGV